MLDIVKLKADIENNTVSNNLIIFKCDKSNGYIPRQYAKAFRDKNNCDIICVEEESELPRGSLFGSLNPNLFLYIVDTLSEFSYKEVDGVSVWVICNKINKKVKTEYEDSIVELPKLQDWQIRDFICSVCPSLDDKQVTELFTYYKDDLYRLENELSKIKALTDMPYSSIQSQLFVDNTNYNVFDIVNAIVRRDKTSLSAIYDKIDFVDVDPFGLVVLLINNFKHIIDVQLSKNPTAESVGVSGKQFWAIKNYSCGHYNREELVAIFEFLNDIDYKVKAGLLDTNIMLDYIICKILSM